MNKTLIVIFFLLISRAQAQDITVRLRVLDKDSLKAVSFANIQNKTSKRSSVSDENGFAMLKVHVGDTLLISSLGYYTENFVIYTVQLPPIVNIELKAHNYTLSEATIKGIRTPDDLKKAILRMRIEENPYAEIKGVKSYKGPYGQAPATFMSPISLIYESDMAKRNRAKKWQKNITMPKMK